MGLTIFMPELA